MYEISDDTRRELAFSFFQFPKNENMGRDDLKKLEIEYEMAMREYLDLQRTHPDSADILIPARDRVDKAFRKFYAARQKYLAALYGGKTWKDIVASRDSRYIYQHG